MAGLDRCKSDVRAGFTSQVVVEAVTTRKLRRVRGLVITHYLANEGYS